MPKNSKGREIAEIIPGKCIGCQLCIGECPVKNVIVMEGGVAKIDPEGCIGCGKCVDVCPVKGAILFEKPRRKKVAKAGAEPGPKAGYPGTWISTGRGNRFSS
jgi:ferredoxin